MAVTLLGGLCGAATRMQRLLHRTAIPSPYAEPVRDYRPLPDYARLAAHLASLPGPGVTLTLAQVEEIAGGPLPLAARIVTRWWNYAPGARNPQGRGWVDAGWRVEQVDLHAGTVSLVREATG